MLCIIVEVRVSVRTAWIPLTLATACTATEAPWSTGYPDGPEIAVAVADRSPTTLKVSWPELDPRAALTLVTDDGSSLREAPVEPGAVEAMLMGFPPDTEVMVALEARIEGVTLSSAAQWVTTGPLPNTLPTFTTFATTPDALDKGLVLTSAVGPVGAAMILNADGEPVWWRELEGAGMSWNPRARLAPDGRSVVIGQMQDTILTTLYRFGMDGEELERITVPGAHHDFALLPDGTIAVLVAVERQVDGVPVRIDELQEIAPDGSLHTVWSVTDDIAYDASLGLPDELTSWSHANFLQYDPAQDAYLVGLLALSSALLIDRESGQSRWTVGGPGSSFVHAEDGPIWLKHGMDLTEDGLLVFENIWGNGGSGVREYTLDAQTDSALLSWEWAPAPSISTMTLGDAHRLSDGTTLVSFGTAGRIDQVDRAGGLRFSVGTSLGDPLGYAEAIPSLQGALSVPR